METLVVLIVGLLIAAPIVAIVAYVRVQDLTAKLKSTGLQNSVTRLNFAWSSVSRHSKNSW